MQDGVQKVQKRDEAHMTNIQKMKTKQNVPRMQTWDSKKSI